MLTIDGRPIAAIALTALLCISTAAQAAGPSEAASDDGTAADVTFAGDVAAILHEKCSGCHRPGQSGPFSLLSWEDADEHAETIAAVIADGYMPPWPPSDASPKLKGDRSLSDDQKATLAAWADGGFARGELSEAPQPPTYATEWKLGPPDMVLEMERSYDVPADGRDIYRWFSLPLDSDRPLYLKAYEFKSTANGAVHHSLLYLDESQAGRKRESGDGQPGFRGMRVGPDQMLGGFVPGSVPQPWPEGVALEIPAGSDLVLQTHFHPTGRAEQEKSRLALYFADQKPERPLRTVQMPPGFGRAARIRIPAGEADYTVTDTFTLPSDVTAIGVSGHAHYICTTIRLDALTPGGKPQTLLDIDDWDLDWQGDYQFAEPIDLPAGTVLTTTLTYDNSAGNPDNPFSPPRAVRWGPQSTDEMGSTDLLVLAEDAAADRSLRKAIKIHRLTEFARPRPEEEAKPLTLKEKLLFHGLDSDQDGELQRGEVPEKYAGLFPYLDVDTSGGVSREEMKLLRRLQR